MDPPHIKSSWRTQNKNSKSMGIGLGNDDVTCNDIAKWIRPHIKSSCGTQNQNSNPMGIGLGMDYVTWKNIQKCIPPTSNLHVGHKIKIPIQWVEC